LTEVSDNISEGLKPGMKGYKKQYLITQDGIKRFMMKVDDDAHN